MPTVEESQRNWRRTVREFGSESHRGAALVAAALLDLNLEDLLRTFMIDDPSEVEYLLGSGLQSYGARIRIAYALGLVSDDEANDLRVIQSVRNYFAHNLHVTFEAEVVKLQLKRLRLLRRVLPEAGRLSPRRQLEQAACMLSVVLVQRLEEVAAIRRQRHPEQETAEMMSQCLLLNEYVQDDEQP
jgi:DNA-binding MltR family transcriptional regulator